jgi:hypothetical protein
MWTVRAHTRGEQRPAPDADRIRRQFGAVGDRRPATGDRRPATGDGNLTVPAQARADVLVLGP